MSIPSRRKVVDAKDHLLGRLAEAVSKELLSGGRIDVVRCEEISISGPINRNRAVFMDYLHKRHLTNPTRGHFHYRSPSRMLYKAIRGMIPYKTERGAAALRNLRVFEGVPNKLVKTKRVCVPAALRAARLRPGASITRLGNLSASVGWKQAAVVSSLEKKRKLASVLYFRKKQQKLKLWKQAESKVAEGAEFKKIQQQLAALGY
ncbi:ribosomal protein L16 [Acrasis kona]|uniref:Ribosomal protein L16 n=1 Tax=Acrasis kona TaxID=1008807 RepID=A0AAW2ZKD6_9EUKA